MNKIEELEATVKNVLLQIEELKSTSPNKYKRLSNTETYWTIRSEGIIIKELETDHFMDNGRFDIGNYYHSKADAEKALVRKKAYVKIVRALREHEGDADICDWHDLKQIKYSIYASTELLTKEVWLSWREQDKSLYTTSEKARDWVFDNLQEELKIWYEVEE